MATKLRLKITLFLFFIVCVQLSAEQVLLVVGKDDQKPISTESVSKENANSTSTGSDTSTRYLNTSSTIDRVDSSTESDDSQSGTSMKHVNSSSSKVDLVLSIKNSTDVEENTTSSTEQSSTLNYSNQTAVTQASSRRSVCPLYVRKKDAKKEVQDFMNYSYDTAIDLCNTSSRVGCRFADFSRQILSCVNFKYFDFIDISDELNENKDLNELPKEPDSPVLGKITLKVLNIEAISVKNMDFEMGFYLGKFKLACQFLDSLLIYY